MGNLRLVTHTLNTRLSAYVSYIRHNALICVYHTWDAKNNLVKTIFSIGGNKDEPS